MLSVALHAKQLPLCANLEARAGARARRLSPRAEFQSLVREMPEAAAALHRFSRW